MFAARSLSSAEPEVAWALLAEPRNWSRWAPHIRGAVGLGDPEVEVGRSGFVFVGLGVPIPVKITEKTPGGCWEWKVGLARTRHQVTGRAGGCEVAVEVQSPFSPLLRSTYGLLLPLLMRNLARVAAEEQLRLGQVVRDR